MSIEKITSKITAEAEAVRAQLLAEAEKECDAILSQAKQQAESLIREEEERGRSEREKIVSRRKSVAGIDCRKLLLAKKQELIGRCFEKAVDAIAAMEEEAYISLLTSLGMKTGLKEGKLIFNGKERDSIGQKVADGLNRAVEGGNFAVSEETRNLRSGYLLRSGNVYINLTAESLVEEFRDELSGEVHAMLFAES